MLQRINYWFIILINLVGLVLISMPLLMYVSWHLRMYEVWLYIGFVGLVVEVVVKGVSHSFYPPPLLSFLIPSKRGSEGAKPLHKKKFKFCSLKNVTSQLYNIKTTFKGFISKFVFFLISQVNCSWLLVWENNNGSKWVWSHKSLDISGISIDSCPNAIHIWHIQ